MDKITVTFDLTEATLNMLRELLRGQSTEPAKTEPAKTEPAKTEPAKTEPAKTEPTKTEPTKTEPVETETVKTEPAKTEPTKTDVRALALKLSKAGRQDVLKSIFNKYGAEKLSAIADADYPALLKDLEAANV